MPLYNNGVEPAVNISVVTQKQKGTIAATGAFNTIYLLGYFGATSTFAPGKAELITSLSDFENRVGGVPTSYVGLVNYLSLAAAIANSKQKAAIEVISVTVPASSTNLTVTAPSLIPTGESFAYKLNINGTTFNGTVAITSAQSTIALQSAAIATGIAKAIEGNLLLQSSVYVRDVVANSIELTSFVSGQALSVTPLASTLAVVGTTDLVAAAYSQTVDTNPYTIPVFKDYAQALYQALANDEESLGWIIAPGFFATSTKAEAFKFSTLADTFCRRPGNQYLFITDVTNPDPSRIGLYSTVPAYVPGQALATGFVKFDNTIYSGSGLVAVPNAAVSPTVTVGTRVKLTANTTINGVTGPVIQAIAPAAISNIASLTNAEKQNFVVIPAFQLVTQALNAGTLTVVEKTSATEQGLYDYRDAYDSPEGHLSLVAPYQSYIGTEVLTSFVIPASGYSAGLWSYTANTINLAQPPASDEFPLENTSGGVWQVTRAGHGLLNGKGINIIKNIAGNQYIMGSRTLSKLDLYNRQNARAILSLYVRTLRAVLNQGLVLQPLTSTGIFLSQLKLKADTVSEAFFRAGLLDGANSADAYNNKCDSEINPTSQLQQGFVRLESKITEIGMTEQITITVQEALLGSLQSIL
jgi:hypothetical protein